MELVTATTGIRKQEERSSPLTGPALPKQQRMSDSEVLELGSAVAEKSDTSEARRRKEEAGDLAAQGGLRNIVAAVSSLVLSMAREQALIRSILVHVILYPAASATMQEEVKEATKRYSVEGASLTAEQKRDRGSPHLYAWNGMLTHHKALPEVEQHVKDIEHKAATMVEEQVAAWSSQAAPPQKDKLIKKAREVSLQEMVFVARCTTCWDPSLVRLELCTKAGTSAELAARSIMQVALTNWKGEKRLGQAPRGKLERKISAWLSSLQGGKGKGKGKGKGTKEASAASHGKHDWDAELADIMKA